MNAPLPRTPAIESRLPRVGTTIFTVMSALAQQHGAVINDFGGHYTHVHVGAAGLYAQFVKSHFSVRGHQDSVRLLSELRSKCLPS